MDESVLVKAESAVLALRKTNRVI